MTPDENPFDKFLQSKKSKIFKNKDALLHTYTPERLPHRDEQINTLVDILGVALEGHAPKNIMVYGMTGSGKTVTVKYILKKLEEKASEIGALVRGIYVNCEVVDTSYRVLQTIANNLISEWEERIPPTGLPTDEVYTKLIEILEKYGGIVVVALDEIDRLVKKSGDSVIYMLTRINESLKHSKLSLIGIANDINFIDLLDVRVRSSLVHEKVLFPPYNARQLEDILRDRAKIAFYEGVLEPSVIPFCAAASAREYGDARVALDLLRTAGEIAERNGESKVREGHVRLAIKRLEMDTVIEAIKTLPTHGKAVLYALYKKTLSEMRKGKRFSEIETTTGELYQEYSNVCYFLGISPVTQRRFTDFVSYLDEIGLLNARIASRGRYGRTKIIKLASDISYVEEGLKSDPEFGSLFMRRPVQTSLEKYFSSI